MEARTIIDNLEHKISELGTFTRLKHHNAAVLDLTYEALEKARDLRVESLALMEAFKQFTNSVSELTVLEHDARQEVLRLYALLIKTDGGLHVEFWQRDCDCCEATHTAAYETRDDLDEAINDFHDGAEGPTGWHLITKEEYENFTPEMRDRAAEQMGY